MDNNEKETSTENIGEINEDNIEVDAQASQDADIQDAATEKCENDKAVADDCENCDEEKDENGKSKDKKDEMLADLKDRLVRNMAEFDNYRKRTDKEKSAMFEVGAKSIVEKILPVIDNFERGFAAATDEEKESPFYQGMDKIYKQMVTALEEAGVKAIDAVGQPFNPDFHNAVMHVEDESFEENTVAEEFQKGYMYRDSVVRHSMVKVAN